MADVSTSVSTTPGGKRSQLVQADAAMANLQADIEKRRDNNLAMIQSTFDHRLYIHVPGIAYLAR